MRVLRRAMALLMLILASPCAGLAHGPDPGSLAGAGAWISFAAGFNHPATGADHVIALLAIGFWAGARCGDRLRLGLGAVIAAGIVGSLWVRPPLASPYIEVGMLTALIGLGLAMAGKGRRQTVLGAALAFLLALLGTDAPGSGLPEPAGVLGYAAGYALASAVLLGLGVGLARLGLDATHRHGARGAGMLIALAGPALAVLMGPLP